MSEGFETHERIHQAHGGEHAAHGARWISVAAATFAVLAAVASLLGNVRATAANGAKADAIIAQTRASDTYNEYESRSIKRHIYEAAAVTDARDAARLTAVARHERTAGDPLLEKARAFEHEAAHDLERSERFLSSYETIEVGATLLEIAIVLVSISAFARGRALPIGAGLAAAVGILVAIAGLAR